VGGLLETLYQLLDLAGMGVEDDADEDHGNLLVFLMFG
jgi:hypothetical protein